MIRRALQVIILLHYITLAFYIHVHSELDTNGRYLTFTTEKLIKWRVTNWSVVDFLNLLFTFIYFAFDAFTSYVSHRTGRTLKAMTILNRLSRYPTLPPWQLSSIELYLLARVKLIQTKPQNAYIALHEFV